MVENKNSFKKFKEKITSNISVGEFASVSNGIVEAEGIVHDINFYPVFDTITVQVKGYDKKIRYVNIKNE